MFHSGRGVDINLDHHRAGSFANLFTNINLGYGLRPFASGGRKDRGAHSGGWASAVRQHPAAVHWWPLHWWHRTLASRWWPSHAYKPLISR